MAQVCSEDACLLRLNLGLAPIVGLKNSDRITESYQISSGSQWCCPQPYAHHLCCIAPALPPTALCLPAAAFTEAILLPGRSDPCN